MPKITDLSPQKGKKDRVSVFLNGNFVCGLQTLTMLQHRLKIGDEITLDALEAIQLESDVGAAFERAVNYLSSRLKSEKELGDYLKGKGYMPKVVEAVIAKLKEYRYLDDVFLTESYIRTYSNNSGKIKLKFDLSRKGISKDIIEKALQQMEPNEDACLGIAQKYMNNKEHNKQTFMKLSRHLAGRGFEFEKINKCIKQISDMDLEE